MRLPGAALLITIGILLLWIATTGKLDKLGIAWTFITDKSGNITLKEVTPTTAAAPACDPSSGICDYSRYATEGMMHALTPGVAITNPGGMN